MHAYVQMTGKTFPISPNLHHDIKCTVNDVVASFTVTNNTKCSFGLFDKSDKLIGYIHPRKIDMGYPSCAAINGEFNIVVKKAPIGSHVKIIESFHIDYFGKYTTTLH